MAADPRERAIGVLHALAAWASGVDWRSLRAPARAQVGDTLVDTVGVTLAGAAATELVPVVAAAEELGWLAPGRADWWGRATTLRAPAAALMNATAAHVLDFDDVHHLLHGHPSAVLWPALVAVAQEDGLPGSALGEGYVAGVGVMAAVARLLGPDHYTVGWHATSTVGAIGAAAGVAVARDGDREEIAAAMATAVSMASGVRASFGSVLKPLHAGLAARSAVEAARLARAGVRPSETALAGPLGAFAVMGDGSFDPSADGAVASLVDTARDGLGDLGLKPYPACRGAHYAIDAALAVHEQLAGREVVEVRVDVPLGTRTALLHDDPADGLQARFSLPYAVAVTLAHGAPQLSHFTDDAVRDIRTRALMRRLRIIEDDSAGDLSGTMAGRYAVVTATTADGRRVTARTDHPRGSTQRPMTRADVDRKFLRTVGEVWSEADAAALLSRLRAPLEALDVRGMLGH